MFHVFGVLTSLSGLTLALMIFYKQAIDSKTSTRVGLGIYWRIATSACARPILFIGFLEGVFFFSAFAFVASFLRDSLGWDYISIGLTMTGYGFGGAAYALLSRKICSYINSRQRILVSGLLLSSSYLFFPWL